MAFWYTHRFLPCSPIHHQIGFLLQQEGINIKTHNQTLGIEEENLETKISMGYLSHPSFRGWPQRV